MAYKSNNVDTCRGCVMARYDSDFQWRSSEQEAIIVEFWASILFEEMTNDSHEARYEITLLMDGEQFFDDYQKLENQAKQISDGRFKVHQDVLNRKEEERRQVKKEQEEKDEKARLAFLKKKYEDAA